tara:strand:- start:1520 stop:1960 length:441 start_codon:yes stop_codon:yes gene_type:complete
MAYIQKHNYKGVFKMQETPMTDAEVRAKYDKTAPKPKPVDDWSENATPAVMPTPVKKPTKPVPPGGAANNFAKERKAIYGDVMDKQSKPILNPLKLFTSNKFNNPRWEGRMMDAAVESVKNAVIPGRFFQKVRKAYEYNKITKNKF